MLRGLGGSEMWLVARGRVARADEALGSAGGYGGMPCAVCPLPVLRGVVVGVLAHELRPAIMDDLFWVGQGPLAGDWGVEHQVQLPERVDASANLWCCVLYTTDRGG